jgi:hypothetical protein
LEREEREAHYRIVARALEEGRVVPLLGAGVNLCDRAEGESWVAGGTSLPSGRELARHLVSESEMVDLVRDRERDDLGSVSQTVATMWGRAYLYEKLHEVFDADYEPTTLHRFLARLPAARRARGSVPPHQLILTTNYDDALERAFQAAGEEYDIVWYVADGRTDRGKFWHWPPPQPETEPNLIERPNEYDAISLEKRTVILKFHGAVDRSDPKRDSYVITEDHYIDYLTRTHVTSLVPVEIIAKLTRSHFLFLAYALRDWNVRVILHRIWAAQALDYPSWAVQRDTHPVDRRLWERRNVEILPVGLATYVHELAARLGVSLEPAAR